jgi:SAM-dependent methyltransferase
MLPIPSFMRNVNGGNMMEIYHGELSDVTRFIESNRHISLEDKQAEFEQLLDLIERFKTIDGTSRILEIGTGTGWFPLLCKKQGLRCKGIEISPALVEYAGKLGERYGIEPDIELGNIEETSVGVEQYDVIIAMAVFEHVENWRRGIEHVYKGLKPGGLLYFWSTNKFSFTSGEYHIPLYGWLPDALRYRLRIARQGADIMKLGIDFNQFTYQGLRRFFKQTGFSTVMDPFDIFDPNTLHDPRPWKRIALRTLRRIPPLRHLALVFAPGTCFICIK